MKTNFFERILKWNNIPVLILLLLFSCENTFVSEDEIQQQILQDEDFVEMLANIYTLEYVEKNESQQKKIAMFDSFFALLDKRYDSFYANSQKAMANKHSIEYAEFTKNLEKAVSELLPSESARIAVVYNGASICGRESCGNSAQDNTTLGCIAGARFGQEYCLRNNMGNCSEMREALIDQCCESFCNPQD